AADRPEAGPYAPEVRKRGRDGGAERELPRAGKGREVRSGRPRPRRVDRPGKRHPSENRDHPQERDPAASAEGDKGEEKRRPDEVELLLDRQAPEMEERRRGLALREVVASVSGEVDVRPEDGGPEAVRDHLPSPHEVEQVMSGHVGGDQGQERRRKDAARAPPVELRERDRAASLRLDEEDPRDQETGEEEEDVDPD